MPNPEGPRSINKAEVEKGIAHLKRTGTILVLAREPASNVDALSVRRYTVLGRDMVRNVAPDRLREPNPAREALAHFGTALTAEDQVILLAGEDQRVSAIIRNATLFPRIRT